VSPHDAAIVRISLLSKKLLRPETSQQPGNIRLWSNHHVADSRAGESAGGSAAQNAQHVILSWRKAERLESVLKGAMQAVGRTHEGQQSLLIGTGEALSLLDSL